jgi:LysM repeat protein
VWPWLLAAGCLAACDLPDPPARPSQSTTSVPLLAVTPAPTLDALATATALARSPTPDAAASPPAPPSATPEPTPAADEPERYVIQAGDTLTSVAARYGSTVEAIVAANGLSDPNAVEVGQEIVIP